MNAFTTKSGVMHAEGVSVETLAKRYGTPLYVYSLNHVLENYHRLSRAFTGLDQLVCFSLKANANMGILAALAQAGCGFDIVSGGELNRVLKAGADPKKIIFAGVGKTDLEIAYALKQGIFMLNIESWPEAEAINRVAGKLKKKVKVDFRINPDVKAKTHKYINTSKKASKFGLPYHEASELFRKAKALPNIEVTGIHLHIGSQITELQPFVAAAKRALILVKQLRKEGHNVQTLNMGGGLGIVYSNEPAKSPEQYAKVLAPLFKGQGLKLIFEPGRYFVGNAGILVTEVIYVKETAWKDFVIVDAAMNDLIRPSLYEAYHGIAPVRIPKHKGKLTKVDIVGPVCESGDFLAQDRTLNLPVKGDLLAVESAGAYGMVMASNYNQRGRAAEILVSGKQHWLTRKRETWNDLLRGESIPAPFKPKKK